MLNMLDIMFKKEGFFLLLCWICWICWMFFGPMDHCPLKGFLVMLNYSCRMPCFLMLTYSWRMHLFFMLNYSCRMQPFFIMLNFSAERKVFLSKYASFCCNVEYVESCCMQCSKKTLLSAEMLNMLNMLNVFWPMTPPLQTMGLHGPKKHSTYSTYSTFQQKEAFFSELYIQHDSTYSTFQQKEAHFEKKMLVSGKKFNMAQKVVLSAEKIQHGPKSGYFSIKNSTWPKKWFFQQKKFNMCQKCASFCWNVEYVECIGRVVRHFC